MEPAEALEIYDKLTELRTRKEELTSAIKKGQDGIYSKLREGGDRTGLISQMSLLKLQESELSDVEAGITKLQSQLVDGGFFYLAIDFGFTD